MGLSLHSNTINAYISYMYDSSSVICTYMLQKLFKIFPYETTEPLE
jgi:hypothetical protein